MATARSRKLEAVWLATRLNFNLFTPLCYCSAPTDCTRCGAIQRWRGATSVLAALASSDSDQVNEELQTFFHSIFLPFSLSSDQAHLFVSAMSSSPPSATAKATATATTIATAKATAYYRCLPEVTAAFLSLHSSTSSNPTFVSS